MEVLEVPTSGLAVSPLDSGSRCGCSLRTGRRTDPLQGRGATEPCSTRRTRSWPVLVDVGLLTA
jgi:hypothetical protein